MMNSAVVTWLRVYRLLPWKQKVSGARLMLYAVLGYAFAGHWAPYPLALNTLALLGLSMFQAALNDYWDVRIAREPNAIGALLQTGRLTSQQAIRTIAIPLVLVLPMLLGTPRLRAPWSVPTLLVVGAVLSVAYSTPPLRVKTRRPWGVLMAPLLTTLMFLEAHLALAPLTPIAIGLAAVLWHFQLYAELLHIVAMSPRSAVKYSPARALHDLPWLASAGAALSLLLTFVHPMFWLSVAGWAMRFRTLRTASIRQAIAQGRAHILSRVLGLYEFAAYGGMGLVHAWRS